jgi:hypothetical protein
MDDIIENESNSSALTEEEEALLREFEVERAQQKNDPSAAGEKQLQQDTDINELRRMIEEEMREKIGAEMRAKIEAQLRVDLAAEIRAEIEPDIRKQVESEMRERYGELMTQVEGVEAEVAGHEQDLRRKIEAELETRLRRELELERNKKQEEILKKLEKIESIEFKTSEITEKELRSRMKADIMREIEEERQRKKEELLKKIEMNQKASAQLEMQREKVRHEQQKEGATAVTHTEKLVLLRLFEDTQKILHELMGSYLTTKKVEHIFSVSVTNAVKKNPDVLKKINLDRDGKPKQDGSIEVARVLANVNALEVSEDKKSMLFFRALRDIFDERVVEIETAIDVETREKIVSELLNRINRIFGKNEYNKKMGAYFMDFIVPNTSLQSGDR